MDETPLAVIVDVIGSRTYPDRSAVQNDVEALLAAVTTAFPPEEPFAPTVGDELQAVYASRNRALAATLYASLLHDDGPELRFGLGQGEVYPVRSAGAQRIEDGPGWWRAREALQSVEHLQARHTGLRTRYLGPDEQDSALVNAYLLTRDHLLAALNVRTRSYARGMVEGKSQQQIAQEQGVSQPAVSKSLKSSGAAALILGLSELSLTPDSTAEGEP